MGVPVPLVVREMNGRRTSRIVGRVLEGKILHIWDVERLWQLARGLEVVEVSIDDLSDSTATNRGMAIELMRPSVGQ